MCERVCLFVCATKDSDWGGLPACAKLAPSYGDGDSA